MWRQSYRFFRWSSNNRASSKVQFHFQILCKSVKILSTMIVARSYESWRHETIASGEEGRKAPSVSPWTTYYYADVYVQSFFFINILKRTNPMWTCRLEKENFFPFYLLQEDMESNFYWHVLIYNRIEPKFVANLVGRSFSFHLRAMVRNRKADIHQGDREFDRRKKVTESDLLIELG